MTGLDSTFIVAAVDLLGRTGAKETQIRYSDDQEPTIWVTTARWEVHGSGAAIHQVWRTGSGLTPDDALYDLLEDVIDGGVCTHCRRLTQVERDHTEQPILPVCIYAFDPELKTFRRSCKGDR